MKIIKGFYIGFSNGYITLSDVIDEDNQYYTKLTIKSSKPLNVEFKTRVQLKLN